MLSRSPFLVSLLHHNTLSAGRARWRVRLTVLVSTRRLDEALAFGGRAAPGTALGVHAQRLTSDRERHALAQTLRKSIREAHEGRPCRSAGVPIHRVGVAAAEEVINAITLRLHGPRPVGAMGMARLRRLLADGAGPMYVGRGDLDGRLRGVLAAL